MISISPTLIPQESKEIQQVTGRLPQRVIHLALDSMVCSVSLHEMGETSLAKIYLASEDSHETCVKPSK